MVVKMVILQKRQGQSNSKSRSEKFNPHPEEVASGFPIDPPRPSQAIEDGSIDTQGPLHKRASHSGPLAHRAVWAKAGKNLDDAPKVSTGADLSTLSSLVAARRSLLSEDRREKSGSSQPDVSKLIVRFPGSFKEASESTIQQDQKHQMQGAGRCTQKEDGRMTSKDPVLVSSWTYAVFLNKFSNQTSWVLETCLSLTSCIHTSSFLLYLETKISNPMVLYCFLTNLFDHQRSQVAMYFYNVWVNIYIVSWLYMLLLWEVEESTILNPETESSIYLLIYFFSFFCLPTTLCKNRSAYFILIHVFF